MILPPNNAPTVQPYKPQPNGTNANSQRFGGFSSTIALYGEYLVTIGKTLIRE